MLRSRTLLGLSLSATLVLNLPFLLYYDLSWTDTLGSIAILSSLGPFFSWSYAAQAKMIRSRFSKEWQIGYALFPPTFALILQAIWITTWNQIEHGSILPRSLPHWVMLGCGVTSLIILLWLPSALSRIEKRPTRR